MINELTPAQEARLIEFRDEWRAVGTCTDPADRPRAEAAIAELYGLVGRTPPRFVWCGSPWACNVAITRAKADGIEAVVNGDVDPRGPFECVSTSLWGQMDAHWIAMYLFGEEIGVEYDAETGRKLHLYADIARSACWWYPFDLACFVSERPAVMAFDDQGRLHREDGPAVRFRDGWSIYSLGGVRVDEQVVMRPHTQDVAQIRNEQNAEVKRLRIERFGWERYLEKIGATVVDVRRNDVEATKEALMKTPDDMQVLVCSCPSTARVYALEVPSEVRTCEEAQNWLSGGLSARIINGA